VLISDDSDFCEPLQIAHEEMGKRIGVINPHRRRPTRSLNAHSDFTKQVTVAALSSSQFPDPVVAVGHKPINKPAGW
jgi:hypothetical protein